uniref:Uncharacterized protein n=1 Tax=Oryza brachyantha TaxID=4533 RepID=J3M8V5_ORYBR
MLTTCNHHHHHHRRRLRLLHSSRVDLDDGPEAKHRHDLVPAESGLHEDLLPLPLVPLDAVDEHDVHIEQGLHLPVLLLRRPCSDDYVHDYHLPSGVPGRDGLLAVLQYLDALVVAPVVKNPLEYAANI